MLITPYVKLQYSILIIANNLKFVYPVLIRIWCFLILNFTLNIKYLNKIEGKRNRNLKAKTHYYILQ